jgi:HK97 family phage major capsid protein
MTIRRKQLPMIRLEAPRGFRFEPPKQAVARWDRTILAKAAPPKEVVIEMFDAIGAGFFSEGVTAKAVSAALREAGRRPVTVQINSPGGDLMEGVAIYNLLRDHPERVTVRVVGMAASAASVIAMAGDSIDMDQTSWQMIHSPWGMVIGDARELKEFADLLSRYEQTVAELYAARTGREAKDIIRMMKAETWMDSAQAVEEKFADRVIPNEPREGLDASARTARSRIVTSVSLASSGLSAKAVGAVLASMKPGASGGSGRTTQPTKGTNVKTIKEQIAAFEAKRAAAIARMTELINVAADAGRSLERAEAEEHDTLKDEIEQIDQHLVRLHDHDRLVAATAAPVTGVDGPEAASAARGGAQAQRRADGGYAPITVRSNAPKGAGFTRYVIALAATKGNKYEAVQLAKGRWPDMPEVQRALMAAVDPGTTTDATWAAPLVEQQNLVSEFIELLRPATIVGRITNFRVVPFNVKMPRQTGGSSVGWVGQGKPKPVSELAFDSVSLGFAKISGIVVLTEELVRFSSPAAEAVVRGDLIETVAGFQDQQFIDPDVAAVANVSPASPLNGTSPVTSSGSTVAQVTNDVKELMQKFVTANISLLGGVWVMNPRTALALSMLRTSQDVFAFPTINVNGGTFFGLPVITSNSVPIAGTSGNPTIIVLLAPSDILFADEGGVTIDVSREASLQMDSAPSSGAQSLVSLWQNNLVGLRAERFVNYLKRRAAAAQYIDAVTY